MVAITEPVTACQNSKIIRETALADYYAMLAVLSQFPTEDLYSGLIDGSLRQDFLSIAAELSLETKSLTEPLSELASLKEDLETGASSMMKLRREYSRLFNNPDHPVIYLYEGVFIDEELRRAGKPDTGARLFVNPAALDAERCYRQAGLKRSAKINIPADSVSTELEFMAYLYTADRVPNVGVKRNLI